jgi:hypothetical protein
MHVELTVDSSQRASSSISGSLAGRAAVAVAPWTLSVQPGCTTKAGPCARSVPSWAFPDHGGRPDVSTQPLSTLTKIIGFSAMFNQIVMIGCRKQNEKQPAIRQFLAIVLAHANIRSDLSKPMLAVTS